MSRAWRWFVLAAAGGIVLYFALHALGLGGGPTAVVYDLIGAGAVVAMVVGARRAAGPARMPLLALALGNLLFVGGDLLWDAYELILHQEPFPSAADGLYLSGYPLLAAGLVMLIRRRTPGRERAGAVDAAIVTAGVGLLSWVFLIRPYVVDTLLGGVETGFSIAYPLGDLLLLGLAARLVVGPGRRNGSFWLLISALLCSLVADGVFGALNLFGSYHAGHAVDALWLLAYVLWGAAALHPAARGMAESSPPSSVVASPGRLVFLAAAALLAPATLMGQWMLFGEVDVIALAAGSAVMFVLVFLRVGGMARELERSRQERGSLLDRALRAGEQERTRIAVDLHDGPIQRLTVLGLELERARILMDRGEPDQGRPILDRARDALVRETDELRQMMAGLRPPVLDEEGVEAALRGQAAALSRDAGVACQVEARVIRPISPELQNVIFRVAQEALINVGRHARATRVRVELEAMNGVVGLRVADDGVGFDPRDAVRLAGENHFGLSAMRERVLMAGGTLHLRSRPGEGTTLEVVVPNRVEP
jgi:signal transduction histidine kinase